MTWRLQFLSHNKNKWYSLDTRNGFLPHSHRLQYILWDTRYCTIAIINHHIPYPCMEMVYWSLKVTFCLPCTSRTISIRQWSSVYISWIYTMKVSPNDGKSIHYHLAEYCGTPHTTTNVAPYRLFLKKKAQNTSWLNDAKHHNRWYLNKQLKSNTMQNIPRCK